MKKLLMMVAALALTLSAHAQYYPSTSQSITPFHQDKWYIGGSLTGLDLNYSGLDKLKFGFQAQGGYFVADNALLYAEGTYQTLDSSLMSASAGVGFRYYFEDNGIRNAIAGGSREGDIEKIIESIIYQHLVRLGYKVYVGQLNAGEVDFVCVKSDGHRVYVQASFIISDDSTREREFGVLYRINDNYPKYVISMTPLLSRSDADGVTHLHLRRFLTDGIR